MYDPCMHLITHPLDCSGIQSGLKEVFCKCSRCVGGCRVESYDVIESHLENSYEAGRLCRRPQNKHKIEIVQASRVPFCGREQSVRVAEPNDRRSKTSDNALADWPFEERNKSHRRGELPLKRINNLVDVGWRWSQLAHY